jgi:cytochrome c oxidase subunit 1
MIPMMIGAPDMALPRMNNWSFWILPFAFTCCCRPSSWPAAARRRLDPVPAAVAADRRWLPVPDLRDPPAGISSIMGAINIIVTILNMRAPGMTLMKMPLFVWTWLITAYLLIAGHAGAGRRGHDAADRQVLRHQLLQRRRRR